MEHIEKIVSKKYIIPEKILVDINVNKDNNLNDIQNKKTESLKKIYNFLSSSFIKRKFKKYNEYKINKKINDEKKVKDEKTNNIMNNINKQLLNNIYILKKDLCLIRTKIHDKYFFILESDDSYKSSQLIKINKNSIIKIVNAESIDSKYLSCYYNVNKINIMCNIIDLNIDYNHNEILNNFYNYVNNKINKQPIIINNFFNYICELQQLFNYNIPKNLNNNIHECFVIKFDGNFDDNELRYNIDNLSPIYIEN